MELWAKYGPLVTDFDLLRSVIFRRVHQRFQMLGRLAQLVEHLVYTERVGSSSLSSPTIPSLATIRCAHVSEVRLDRPTRGRACEHSVFEEPV